MHRQCIKPYQLCKRGNCFFHLCMGWCRYFFFYICGQPCMDYQQVLTHASEFTQVYGQSPFSSPMYARTPSCDQ